MEIRKKMIEKLFEWSQKLYLKFKKKEPWGITTSELLQFPLNSFGKNLGDFLGKNEFELIGKVERHDAYHVLSGFGTNVQDEIALQYLCYGNGKRTPYLTGVLLLGTIILPDYASYYHHSYLIGKDCNPFHHFDYKILLNTDFEKFRSSIFTDFQLAKLHKLQKKFNENKNTPETTMIKTKTLKSFRKVFIVSILLFITIITALIIINDFINRQAQEYLYSQINSVPYNKVGLLLGTGKYTKDGNINLYYTYRLHAAVKLFKSKKIDIILVTGDNSRDNYDEPNDFKKDLITLGIPENKIVLDFAGFSTLDSVIRANKIFGLNSFTVISQKFHNERAIFLAKQNDIRVIGFNAKNVSGKYSIKTELREYLARSKALFDILFGSGPKYLGKPIIIQ